MIIGIAHYIKITRHRHVTHICYKQGILYTDMWWPVCKWLVVIIFSACFLALEASRFSREESIISMSSDNMLQSVLVTEPNQTVSEVEIQTVAVK